MGEGVSRTAFRLTTKCYPGYGQYIIYLNSKDMSHTGRDIFGSGSGANVAIMGTFVVNLPLITSTTAIYTTTVVITNLTPDYAFAAFDNGAVSGATANATGSTARILFSAQPQVGQVLLTYVNNAATVNAGDKIYSFIATKMTP